MGNGEGFHLGFGILRSRNSNLGFGILPPDIHNLGFLPIFYPQIWDFGPPTGNIIWDLGF